jgi:outer membrane lipoprotein-sorting protein
MTRKMKKLLAAIVISALFFGTASPACALDGEKILRQVDRNLNPESYEMYRKLINIEPDGGKKEFVLYTIKKGQDRMVALFLSPASEKGRSTLRLEDNMWLYLPNIGKPLRITSLQSIVGGVFNNSDILRLDYSAEYTVESAEEGEEQYLLKLKARSGAVAYDKIEMAVDKKTVVPTEIKCFASTGILIKTLHYSETKDFGGGLVRPSVLETDSPLQKGYRSVMLFAEIKARDFSDEVFTLNFLPRVEELR